MTTIEKEIGQILAQYKYGNNQKTTEEVTKRIIELIKDFTACGNVRPKRKVLCQLKKGHCGSCQAVVFWEKK